MDIKQIKLRKIYINSQENARQESKISSYWYLLLFGLTASITFSYRSRANVIPWYTIVFSFEEVK